MSFWQRPDIIDQLREDIDFDQLQRIRTERASWTQTKHWAQKTHQLSELGELSGRIGPLSVDCRTDSVTCSSSQAITPQDLQRLDSIAESLIPWRKGPFQILDLEIDTEWRSNLKWDRIKSALGDLAGKRVLDVGCGNGYYMFRASELGPELVLGLDPSVPFLLQFEFVQHFAQIPGLQIELLGAEHLRFFKAAFDVILCMGILYHQKNPIEILRQAFQTLRPGGSAIIESQIIPGDDPVALFPEDRYAKARNVFFVPTVTCLTHWIKRAGFSKVETLSVDNTSLDEQRKTRWSTFESLEDFLDPADSSLTVEGYPAPRRAAMIAYR